MAIEPFIPVTREKAAEILDCSLTTLDAIVAAGGLPPPRQLAEKIRRVYWHPDVFYEALKQRLAPERSVSESQSQTVAQTPTAVQPAAPEATPLPSHPAEGEDSTGAAPTSRRRRRADVRTRLAARIGKLNE